MKRKLMHALTGCILMAGTGLTLPLPVFAEAAHEITQAQPELAKLPLVITSSDGKRHEFSVEVARTPKEQEIGEMFRPSVPDKGGMLFLWPVPQQSIMWMKNTMVPLDMVFIDASHHVQAIAENTVPYSLAPVGSTKPVIATLELKGGMTEKLNIVVGDKVESAALETGMPKFEDSPQGKRITK